MEEQFTSLLTELEILWKALRLQFSNLLLPSRYIQFALLIGCFLAAYLLRRWLSPILRNWMRTREGWPKWRLRVLLTIEKKLQFVFFVAFVWMAFAVMSEVTNFVSRRYILGLVATISTAWLILTLASRLISNPLLRWLATWGLGIYVTLYYLGLVEIVSSFLDSIAIEFGEFRLSLLVIIKAAVVTGLLFAAARVLTQTTSRRIRNNADISPSMQVLAVKGVQIALYGAAVFIGLKAVGFDLTGLAFLSGAIGLGIGFGLQKVVSNLISGVIILLDKSIKPGDVISLGETFGWINALGARYVSVVTRDGKEYLIPNEDLITGQVVNWSHSNQFVRLDIHFGTSYHDDPHKVRKLAIDACSSVPRVLSHQAPVCHIVGFGDSSVDYVLRFWISDPAAGLTNIRGNVFLALWDTFRTNGISIPFPQREVRLLGEREPAQSSQS